VELVADDLANPQIFGGRFAFGGKLKFGLSALTDLNPDSILDPVADAAYIARDPMLFNLAADLDFPLFETDLLSVVFFADAGTMIPVDNGDIRLDFVYDSDVPGDFQDQFRNYGFAGGVLGNIFSGQYRLAYMFQNGLFRHGFYDSTYDRMKGEYIKGILDYLDAAPAAGESTQGIYGSLTWNILNIIEVTGGYKWPWTADGLDFSQDYLHFKVAIQPDVIPLIGIYGSLTYDRTNFVGSMVDGNFSFVDGSTVLKGELVVPVAPTLDVALLLASALERDSLGNVIYVSGEPQAYYVFTLDSRIHF